MIQKNDFKNVVKFWDNDEIQKYYPEWVDDETLLDAFADSNMSCIVINGETFPIAFDKEKALIIVFDVPELPEELADKAVNILQNCPWDDRPVTDKDNYISVVNGLYNIFQDYAF